MTENEAHDRDMSEWTDAEIAEYLRDPSNSTELLPQSIRDSLAERFAESAQASERLRHLLTENVPPS